MQRRAAALYGVFFLVLALASYGMIAAASAPSVSIQNPDHRLGDGDQVTINDREYNVTVSGGSATLAWTEPAATYTAEWAAGDEVTLNGTDYSIAMTDAEQVHLTEVRTLPEDVETREVNDTEYVVQAAEDGTRELVPVSDYLNETQGPALEITLDEAEALDYRGNRTTVRTVGNESATLVWTAPRTNPTDMGEGDVVTLNGQEFVAHFPDDSTLLLTTDIQAYEHELEVQDTFDERINGLWGVTILSALAVVILLSFAYLPSRY